MKMGFIQKNTKGLPRGGKTDKKASSDFELLLENLVGRTQGWFLEFVHDISCKPIDVDQ